MKTKTKHLGIMPADPSLKRKIQKLARQLKPFNFIDREIFWYEDGMYSTGKLPPSKEDTFNCPAVIHVHFRKESSDKKLRFRLFCSLCAEAKHAYWTADLWIHQDHMLHPRKSLRGPIAELKITDILSQDFHRIPEFEALLCKLMKTVKSIEKRFVL